MQYIIRIFIKVIKNPTSKALQTTEISLYVEMTIYTGYQNSFKLTTVKNTMFLPVLSYACIQFDKFDELKAFCSTSGFRL
jgi:hypothetical protein